ncbi:MAG TPA: OmpP1/FadL family transporter, partial [Thermoanaerobaculia bacterium]|nr:OmpP1/FadL family transporter [Thermoanaerobaculia bacterium]
VLVSAICLISSAAFGSGFSIFEQGAKASGMAGAFAATADDPSAIFYNVAGIAQQRDIELLGGATTINFNNEFTGDPNDPFTSGTSGGYARHTFVPPNAYAILPIGENITVGVGLFTAYGLRTDWEDPWVGRFSSRDANLKTVSVEPAIAWQSGGDHKVAIGFGVEYRRAHVILHRNNGIINPFNGRIADVADVYLNSDWESDIGYNAGILLKPNANWRIGASYRTDMDIDFGGDATFTQIPTGNAQLDAIVKAGLPPNQAISTTIPFPSTAIVGIATTMIPTWDIEFDVTHTTWSRFETLNVAFATTPAINLSRPQNWEDTYSYRLGANKKATDNWDVRLGAVFDENPQPTEAVSPLLPDSDRVGICFGIGWHNDRWIVDLSDMVLHFNDRSTNGKSPENFNGTYKTNANLVSLNFGMRFGK